VEVKVASVKSVPFHGTHPKFPATATPTSLSSPPLAARTALGKRVLVAIVF